MRLSRARTYPLMISVILMSFAIIGMGMASILILAIPTGGLFGVIIYFLLNPALDDDA